jgi:hypothetical protein
MAKKVIDPISYSRSPRNPPSIAGKALAAHTVGDRYPAGAPGKD